MSLINLPKVPDLETLRQLPKEQLVEIIVQQQQVIEQLVQAVNHLQVSVNSDSHTSSKPPSTDLLKKQELKPEAATESPTDAAEEPKRKPGGQPGHKGTTRSRLWESRPLRNFTSARVSPLWQSGVLPESSKSASAASRPASLATDRDSGISAADV